MFRNDMSILTYFTVFYNCILGDSLTGMRTSFMMIHDDTGVGKCLFLLTN